MDINRDTWNQLMEQADYILADEQPAQKSAPAEVEITELIEPTVAQTNVEGAFSDIVSVPKKTLGEYAEMIDKTVVEAYQQIAQAFEDARATFYVGDTQFVFFTPYAKFKLVPNRYETGKPWHLLKEPNSTVRTQDVVPKAAGLPVETKQEIYQILAANLPFEEKLHMAVFGKLMSDNQIAKEDYGFTKMRKMLEAMPEFLTFEEQVMGGVPQVLVTLHRMPVWEEEVQNVAAEEEPECPAQVDGLIKLPYKTLTIVNLLVNGQEQMPSQELIEQLKDNYAAAAAAGQVKWEKDHFSFDTGFQDQNGSMITGAIKKTDYGEFPWFFSYAGSKRTRQSSPGKMLEQFAFLGSWTNFLSSLAEMALPERWDFGDAAQGDMGILRRYIQYTFYRLTLEDKILINEDETFAAFNTGLVNVHYDDIYACFEPNPEGNSSKWRFSEFCTKGRRGMGKRLVDTFNPLPQPASYFERKEDLLYDLEKELHTDYEHILIDNVRRLPLEFLKEECHGSAEAMDCLADIEKGDAQSREEAYKDLAAIIEEQPRLFNRMRNRLSDAIDLAQKQVRWNFKRAIPCYFPTRNVMSLMLPLCLVEDSEVDVALVVELTRSGSYQGQTILTLQQAYIDGRLLCRPDSDWLNTSVAQGNESEEME